MVALLVVGLGNPGKEFEGTRHNVGVGCIDVLARRHNLSLRRERQLHTHVAVGRLGPTKAAIAASETYMNESGLAVRSLVRRYLGGDVDRLVVVHDELDLEPGVVRVKLGGGTAGHNGLRSIDAHLHTLEFARVRIGIGKPRSKEQGADHVLSRPSKSERELLAEAIERAADAVELLAEQGLDAAMTATNMR